MRDQLSGGRSVRIFSVIDGFSREALRMEVDLSLPCQCVVCALDQVIEWCGRPQAVRSDNGLE
ncbi:hypothetical protein J1G36_25680 [Pseudomonas carnis]|nr:hypothetical protein [Pseudomonas carnis]